MKARSSSISFILEAFRRSSQQNNPVRIGQGERDGMMIKESGERDNASPRQMNIDYQFSLFAQSRFEVANVESFRNA